MEFTTFDHLFMSCRVVVMIWIKFLDCFALSWTHIANFSLLVQWWLRKHRVISMKDPWSMGLIIMADNLWKEMNARRSEDKKLDCFCIFGKIRHDFLDAKATLQGQVKHPIDLICGRRLGLNIAPSRAPEILEIFWCKPMMGWAKLNVGGSSIGNLGRAGAGGIICDNNGVVVGSFKVFLEIQTNYFAEFKALIEGIQMAKDLEVSSLWIESDLASMVTAVQACSIPWHFVQKWTSLQSYLNSISWEISHCFREVNCIVDFLAKEAAKSSTSERDVIFPNYIREEINLDAHTRPRYCFCVC
ncbi:uncharacterized protein LOC122089706 [Macadamia integrifolia]|uniref:uncharacterized protein LOC122089706 n=1 Tax=Macadamia integrifolia TaxID=60698 RepID=UPI001C4FDCDC|nr:uncharacterized protein LOC122089706 [Macadamia integrifolia]